MSRLRHDSSVPKVTFPHAVLNNIIRISKANSSGLTAKQEGGIDTFRIRENSKMNTNNIAVSVVGLGYVGLPVAVAFGKVRRTIVGW